MKTKPTLYLIIAIAVVVAAFLLLRTDKSATSRPNETIVGAVLPLSGPAAIIGDLIKRGLELGVADANAAHPSTPIRLIIEDSKSNPKDGLTAYRKLVDSDKAPVVIAAFSNVANAVAPAAEQDKILMIGSTVTMPGLTVGKQFTVRFFTSAHQLAGTMAAYAGTKFKRAAVIYANDEYGKNSYKIFNEVFAKAGGQVTGSDEFIPSNTDFRNSVARLLEGNPECLYVPGYGPAQIAIFKDARALKPELILMGDIPMTNPPIYRSLGDLANGVIVPGMPLDAGIIENEKARKFNADYLAKYGEPPSGTVTINYDSIMALADGIAKGQSTATALREYLRGTSTYDGVSGPIKIGSDGEITITPRAMRISGGKILDDLR